MSRSYLLCIVPLATACASAAMPADGHPASSSDGTLLAFELGTTRFAAGDDIHIDEIRGDDPAFGDGGSYVVRGHYTLASHPNALLAINETNGESTGSQKDVKVDGGTAAFELRCNVVHRGWPHIAFYPASGGTTFGGVHFGHGDSVFRGSTEGAIDWVGQPDPRFRGPAYLVADSPFYGELERRLTEHGVQTAMSFNTAFDTHLPEAVGHTLVIAMVQGRMVLPEAYWPSETQVSLELLQQRMGETSTGVFQRERPDGTKVIVIYGRDKEALERAIRSF